MAMALNFDTLKSFDKLKQAGIAEPQARAMLEVIEESSMLNAEQVATKGDIANLEAATKKDFASLEAATKQDFASLEAATKKDFAILTGRIDAFAVSVDWIRRLFFGTTALILLDVIHNFIR